MITEARLDELIEEHEGYDSHIHVIRSTLRMGELVEMMRSLRHQQRAAEWRPIETAPRDGSRFLAYNSVVGSYMTAFEDGEFPMHYWTSKGTWYPQPTHWMPLPSPPDAAIDAAMAK